MVGACLVPLPRLPLVSTTLSPLTRFPFGILAIPALEVGLALSGAPTLLLLLAGLTLSALASLALRLFTSFHPEALFFQNLRVCRAGCCAL